MNADGSKWNCPDRMHDTPANGGDGGRSKWCSDCEHGLRLKAEADLTAARADVERLREALASVLTLEIAPHICRVCRRTIDACDADVTTLPCPGAHGRYLLAETAPKDGTP